MPGWEVVGTEEKEALLALILAPAQNLHYLLSNYATKLEEGVEQG